MKRSKSILGIASLLALVMAVGMFGGHAAAQPATPGTAQNGPHPIRLVGKAISLSGSSLVLTTRQGEFTVNITANTWILVEKNGKVVEGTVSDIKVDKATAVAGMTTANARVIDGRTIAQGKAIAGARPNVPARGKIAGAHVAAGTITAITGNTITLKGEKVAEVIVQTTADTVVLNNGFTRLSTLKVGDKVGVFGEPVKPVDGQTPPASPGTQPQTPASRTVNAWALRVDNGSTQLMVGRVEAINGTTITVKTPKNRSGLALTLDATTGYKSLVVSAPDRKPSLVPASAADLKVGSKLIFEAAPGTDGKTYVAKAVVITPNGATR